VASINCARRLRGQGHSPNIARLASSISLLIHEMPEVTPERRASTPRRPFLRTVGSVETFDLARNLADDALPGQGRANGREFRTAPLMGMGHVGTPFLHDARVYLSKRTVESTPASTVYSNADVGTNAPLVIQSLEEAIWAAIELHDLPASDDATMSAVRRRAEWCGHLIWKAYTPRSAVTSGPWGGCRFGGCHCSGRLARPALEPIALGCCSSTLTPTGGGR
jgi:hypothetical protein